MVSLREVSNLLESHRQETESRGAPTSTDNLVLHPPLPDDSKQEGQCIHNRDRETEFCGRRGTRDKCESSGISLERQQERRREQRRGEDLPALPINKKNHTLPVRLSSNGTA